MSSARVLFDAAAVDRALDAMAVAMRADPLFLVGIQRGGAQVADALQERLVRQGCRVHRGNLDISFYRDDLDTIGPNPEVRPTRLPFDVTGRLIWLVDDVLYTGRTIRAALGELFDYGRPTAIRLAVLVDRGGRQLPIAPDVVGLRHQAPMDCSVKLQSGPEGWRIVQRRVRP
ncbi:MAG: bifunctional pyr operon transcriptional regulator/uracil phosphoribosyltransferase PyrR [Zetaproteobacteria bacterium]|nr:MAG: bifunctional pyr operon transcriptional regulator/uracil phosphoribosyltransferase PyrR [Zetaproteobacteria bacterium]